jgi:hypothetical protein
MNQINEIDDPNELNGLTHLRFNDINGLNDPNEHSVLNQTSQSAASQLGPQCYVPIVTKVLPNSYNAPGPEGALEP